MAKQQKKSKKRFNKQSKDWIQKHNENNSCLKKKKLINKNIK